jgi:hypothetical protein
MGEETKSGRRPEAEAKPLAAERVARAASFTGAKKYFRTIFQEAGMVACNCHRTTPRLT